MAFNYVHCIHCNDIQRLTTLWSKLGAKKMLLKMVDACLAGCCKMIEMCLSIHPLLNCVLDLVRSQKVKILMKEYRDGKRRI